MSKRILTGLAGIAAWLAVFNTASAQNVTEPGKSALSYRQQQVIRIEFSRIQSPSERRMAMRWSDAKKVAETMCRPFALQYFQQQYSDADRVFLGDARSGSLKLQGNELLTGTGQVRAEGGWHYFRFSCQLNPRNGRAVAFHADVTRSESYTSRPDGPAEGK